MQMWRFGLERHGQRSTSWRMSGGPQIFPHAPRSGSLTPWWSQCCCMKQKLGEQKSTPWRVLTESVPWNFGRKQDNTQLRKKTYFHTLRKPAAHITRSALFWNLQQKRKGGRPRITEQRNLEADVKSSGHNWAQAWNTCLEPGEHSWPMPKAGL